MKIICALFLVIFLSAFGNVSVKNACGEINDVRTFAILPFKVSVDTNNLSDGFIAQSLLRSANLGRTRYQQDLYIWLVKNARKKNIAFQDVSTTNDLLKNAGNLDSLKKQQLCTLLNVDVIIFGNVSIIKRRITEGGNIAKGIISPLFAPKNKVTMELNLYDSSGTLLWNKMYDQTGDISTEEIIFELTKSASKSFMRR